MSGITTEADAQRAIGDALGLARTFSADRVGVALALEALTADEIADTLMALLHVTHATVGILATAEGCSADAVYDRMIEAWGP
jgi:hypothetical protein